MTGVLKDLPFAMAYLDDIIIYSSTPEEHLQHIKTVFEKLCHAKLSMELSKCHFFAREIQYLGHILGTEGIRPVPAKMEAIKAMHLPVNPTHSSDTTYPDTCAPGSYYQTMARNSRIRPLIKSRKILASRGYSLHHTTLRVMGN